MRKPFDSNFPRTQGFGENPASYAKFGMKGHNGLDYGLPTGTQVLAPHSGKVIEATNDPSGYGLYIKIENAVEGSVLAHLQSFKVQVGQEVQEGQVVGISDSTGNSTGPHLHWGYYRFPRNRQNGYAGFIDQTSYIGTSPVTSSPTPPMADDKRPGEFDFASNALVDAGYAPAGSGHEYWFNNPADPHKFTNQIKAIISQAKSAGDQSANQQKIDNAYKKGKEEGRKEIKDAVAKAIL